ncbi:MAG: MBL fold metallo-hydrolase [Actinomycetota bacterium]|nr:MBL fold metallo-hydrolase [Actinomycetota bacterium]
MCPHGRRAIEGRGGLTETSRIVAHCLVVESDEGLIVVDTGFGTGDVADPGRLGRPFRAVARPNPTIAETAVAQIDAMGRDPSDVRHVIVTHLDLDHAGGLSDFPAAKVHLFAPELGIAQAPPLAERTRYVAEQWEHGANWVQHEVDGDTWFGFESVRPLPGLGDEVALVPLVGHSKGHSGVAIREADGWLLHCGDAFFFPGDLETPRRCPPGLRLFQNVMQHNRGDRRRNRERLRELHRERGGEVRLICSHDPTMFEHAARAEPR